MKLFWLENDYKEDRRLYNRLKVDIPIIIYIEGKELDGALKDISENGVKISISDIQDIKKVILSLSYMQILLIVQHSPTI